MISIISFSFSLGLSLHKDFHNLPQICAYWRENFKTPFPFLVDFIALIFILTFCMNILFSLNGCMNRHIPQFAFKIDKLFEQKFLKKKKSIKRELFVTRIQHRVQNCSLVWQVRHQKQCSANKQKKRYMNYVASKLEGLIFEIFMGKGLWLID